MRYWLLKSEPGTWSWEDQLDEDGAAEWDGVRNYQARNNMRAMRLGDRAFFYHSGRERRIMGVVEVAAEAHPDSTDDGGVWECVDVRALAPFETPVSLREIRAEPRLAQMALVVNTRLSVQPVRAAEWRIVCRLGGLAVRGGRHG